ncbi:DNA primase small subunit [Sulfobacillus acidophilus DSM 10332]|uniref:DNA primase small subunit n=1 Tax=Sulfobacillus acidophilus (strain ATCC 700253 / DSM 10332 / NAL) TaxID=679936 RepID=G8TZM4_SULAD|nr:DNA primase small subunit [Sulfobacillus acidophilus DSM 10332]
MPNFVNGDLRIPHPERILFPQIGLTRRDLVEYYRRMAPPLLTEAGNKPLTVRRWPHGILGPTFYQKHQPEGGPIRVHTVHELLRWVGQGVIEWHAPLGSTYRQHEWAVLDLDPEPQASWHDVVAVATMVTTLLREVGWSYVMKTSGQDGLHIFCPIEPAEPPVVTAVMKYFAELMAAAAPDLVTVERLKSKRQGRVYVDYLQNGAHRTMVMAYSVRATPDARISWPLMPDQLSLGPARWTVGWVLDQPPTSWPPFDGSVLPPAALQDTVRRFGIRAETSTAAWKW